MKYSLALIVLLAAPALAQPAPPQPAPPQPAPPQPAPPQPPPDQQPPGQEPSWLPGVQDVTAAETATPGKLTLSMTRAVELALKQHPNVRSARAQADAAVGRIEQSKVIEHPTVTLSGTLSGGSRQFSGFFTESETTGIHARADWRIYDFGLTAANVHAAEANAEAAAANVGTADLDVRQSVELAYLESVARRRLVVVAEATVKSEESHLDQAKRFVAAQAHDPIEVAQAQSRLANARSTLAQAQSNEAVALADLRAAIGWVDPTRAPEVDPNWPVPSDQNPPDLAALAAQARQHRPEIVSLDKQIESADASLTAAHDERHPILSAFAQGDYTAFNGNGVDPSSFSWGPQPSWAAGLTLSWLAWDGGKSRADVHVARANEQNAVAQRDELLVQLTSTLEAARATIIASRANVQASTEAVQAAQAQLTLANARYAQGLGSQIELADAQTAVTTAQGNLVSAEWQLNDAWATLRRQLGAP
jgi:OMF family outer membrane factor